MSKAWPFPIWYPTPRSDMEADAAPFPGAALPTTLLQNDGNNLTTHEQLHPSFAPLLLRHLVSCWRCSAKLGDELYLLYLLLWLEATTRFQKRMHCREAGGANTRDACRRGICWNY